MGMIKQRCIVYSYNHNCVDKVKGDGTSRLPRKPKEEGKPCPYGVNFNDGNCDCPESDNCPFKKEN